MELHKLANVGSRKADPALEKEISAFIAPSKNLLDSRITALMEETKNLKVSLERLPREKVTFSRLESGPRGNEENKDSAKSRLRVLPSKQSEPQL